MTVIPRTPPSRRAALVSLAVGLTVLVTACGDDPAPTPPPTRQPATWRDAVPEAVREDLAGYEALVAATVEAETTEQGDVDGLRRELVTRQDELDERLKGGDRDAFAAALARHLTEAAAKGTKNEPLTSALFALFRKLDRSRNYSVYRDLLLAPHLEQFFRLAAADAMAQHDVVRAGEEFVAIIVGDHAKKLDWQAELLELLAHHDSPFVADALLRVMKESRDEQVKIKAAFLGRRYPDERWIPILKAAAETDPAVFVRINAAQTLAVLVGEPALPYLEGLASNPTSPERLVEGVRVAVEDARKTGTGPLARAWRP